MRVRIRATSPSLPRQRLGQRSACLMMRRQDRQSTSSWRRPTTGRLTSLVISGYSSPSNSGCTRNNHSSVLTVVLLSAQVQSCRVCTLDPRRTSESNSTCSANNCGGVSVKTVLLAAIILVSTSSLFAEDRESCPSGTEDMMNYFTMAYPNRLTHHMGPGNANPVYTDVTPDLGSSFATIGRFLWIKSSVGFPWDIKVYDPHYIYDRTTGVSGTDPTAFKRFNIDLPLSKRCVPISQGGGQIKVSSSRTNYTSYAGCSATKTQNLGYVINKISALATYNVGNVGPVKTRTFTYRVQLQL